MLTLVIFTQYLDLEPRKKYFLKFDLLCNFQSTLTMSVHTKQCLEQPLTF